MPAKLTVAGLEGNDIVTVEPELPSKYKTPTLVTGKVTVPPDDSMAPYTVYPELSAMLMLLPAIDTLLNGVDVKLELSPDNE